MSQNEAKIEQLLPGELNSRVLPGTEIWHCVIQLNTRAFNLKYGNKTTKKRLSSSVIFGQKSSMNDKEIGGTL